MAVVDLMFQTFAIFYPLFWLAQAAVAAFYHGMFTAVSLQLFPLNIFLPRMGIPTVLIVITFYYYTFFNLNYLFTEIRIPITCAFTMLGITFYDWTLAVWKYIIAREHFPLVQLIPVLTIMIILVLYNKKYDFFDYLYAGSYKLDFNYALFLGLTALVVLCLVLLSSCFFHAVDVGIAPYPNNSIWVQGKCFGVWIWIVAYQKRGG